jgi:hypothetical protein
MKPLHVELLPPRYPPRRLWWVIAALVAAAAVVWSLDAIQRHQARQLQAQTQQRQQAEQARQRAAAAAAGVQQPLPPYHSSARTLLAQRTHPWPTVLATMESITIEGATPVSLDITAAERSARIELNATSYAAVLAYLQALNQGDPALQWGLLQVNAVAGGGLMTAVFTLQIKP